MPLTAPTELEQKVVTPAAKRLPKAKQQPVPITGIKRTQQDGRETVPEVRVGILMPKRQIDDEKDGSLVDRVVQNGEGIDVDQIDQV